MSKQISLAHYYALHQLMIIKAFGSEEVLMESEMTNEKLYGYGKLPRPNSLGARLQASLAEQFPAHKKVPNGRRLYINKLEYNKALSRDKEQIKVHRDHLDAMLTYIGYSNTDSAFMGYCQGKKIAPQAFELDFIRLKQDKAYQHVRLPSDRGRVHHHANLVSVSATANWWFYFYEYENATREFPVIMRLLLVIESKDDQFTVRLINTGTPYSNYAGRVVFSTENFFKCELKAGYKRQSLYTSLDLEGKADLYTGVFLKNDSLGRALGGTFVLQRIPDSSQKDLEARVIPVNSNEGKQLPRAIRDFLKPRSHAFISNARAFDLENLRSFTIGVQKEDQRYKTHHLFISATILSLNRRMELYRGLKADLSGLFAKNKVKAGAYEEELQKILEARILGKKLADPIPFDAELLNQRVVALKDILLEKIPEITDIHYSRENIDLERSKYLDPQTVHDDDLMHLTQSAAYMLICPYPNISSSCWILLGWAMMLRIPIFLVVQDLKTDLPFISQGSLAHHHIYTIPISSLDDIPGLWNWFAVNRAITERFFEEL